MSQDKKKAKTASTDDTLKDDKELCTLSEEESTSRDGRIIKKAHVDCQKNNEEGTSKYDAANPLQHVSDIQNAVRRHCNIAKKKKCI